MAFGAPFPPTGTVTGGFVSAGSGVNVSSIAGLSFGAVAANRFLVAAVSGSFTGGAVSGVTIGGIAATIVANLQNGTVQTVLAIAAVPTGASGTVAASGVGTGPFEVAVYALYGLGSAVPAATASSAANPSALALNGLPGGSFAIAASQVVGTVNSWSGAVTLDHTQPQGGFAQSVASAANQAGNITAASNMTVTSGGPASVAAAWHP